MTIRLAQTIDILLVMGIVVILFLVIVIVVVFVSGGLGLTTVEGELVEQKR